MAAGKRNENESFKAYKARLKAQAISDKARFNGVVIWDAVLHGTYVRSKHGAIGSKS